MRYALITLTMSLMVLFSGCAKQPEALIHQVQCQGNIYGMKRGECLNMEQLIEGMEPYRVIFLGDHHTSKEAHQFAVEVMDALAAKGYRLHLANEWFTPADNGLLAQYAMKEINDGNFTEKIHWKKKAGFDFELFAPLYHTIQRHQGALYGINLTREERKHISDANVTGMSLELKQFYDTLDTGVSAHRQLLQPYLNHCQSQEGCAERILRVQTAWDTKMALESHRLLEKIREEDRAKLIVFAGAMHFAHDLGIGMRFSRMSQEPFVTLLPVQNDPEGYPSGLGDYLYLYTPSTPDN